MARKRSVIFIGDSGVGYRPEAAHEALNHSAAALGISIEPRWIETEEAQKPKSIDALREADGVWVVPGSPYKSLEGALSAIQFAREQGTPLLGTCAGFQHIVLEYARDVL